MRLAIITALAIFVSAGCSSKKKHEDMSKTQSTAPAEKVEATKAAAKAETAKTEAATKVECKLKGDTRILEVRGKDKGCEIAYTKAGQENVVGSSQYGTGHCDEISTRIKDKLVAAGFACE